MLQMLLLMEKEKNKETEGRGVRCGYATAAKEAKETRFQKLWIGPMPRVPFTTMTDDSRRTRIRNGTVSFFLPWASHLLYY